MSYEEELYRRLTSGQGGSESRYLDRMGADTPGERDFLRNAMAQGQPQVPQTPAPTAGGLGMSPEGMGNMTPAELDAYYKSFADQNINLNPMGGLIGAAQNVDKAITNATTAPGILGDTQLRNIGMGNSNVSPYGLGLGQPMYINPNQYGLLNF